MTEGSSRGTAGPHPESPDARREQQLAAAQQIAHIGSWEWDPSTNIVTWSDELFRIYGLAPRSVEITFESFLTRLHPADRERVQGEVRAAIERGGRFSYAERILRPDGSERDLATVGEVVKDADGNVHHLIGTCRDVTEQLRVEQQQAAGARILELIATGVSLEEILKALVLAIEGQAPETIGSILLLDGTRLRHGAAPSLPDAYNRSIDGEPIGPAAGSCGTAAFLQRQVIVSDIETDPLWRDYRELARGFGLRACWSTPIFSREGRVLGTFALYYRECRTPGPEDFALIARATHLAGIAIERKTLDDQLRALSARIEAVREDERTGMAREIHDELGQALTALKLDAAWVLRRVEATAPPEVVERLTGISAAIDQTIDRVRRIASELRPGMLDDLGLAAAIEWQSHEFEQRTGTPCIFDSNVHEVRFEKDVSTAVFRIVQEALTNVVRHANATRVDIRLHRDGERLALEVTDDGGGITPEAIASRASLGLLGVRERARRLGGKVSVAGAPGRGTRIGVEIPLAAPGTAP